ncbi:MAG: 30S ribosomal protein S17 [Acidobacteriota bacterium]|nr:30S ribosomal protein S17 [Acidobacteriota bacterium]MDH3528479.1 30S ribosomal protein S17 [Acidobacteriota bacterium]
MAEKKKKDEAVEEAAAENAQTADTQPEAEAGDESAAKKSEAKKSKPETPAVQSESTASDGSGRSKRAEKVGVVFSDKMTKTVVVRVDRTLKHPMYRKYMKKRKKFMAHNEMGASEGDKVRIVETRPLSAKKRWRVVEIIQKAQK